MAHAPQCVFLSAPEDRRPLPIPGSAGSGNRSRTSGDPANRHASGVAHGHAVAASTRNCSNSGPGRSIHATQRLPGSGVLAAIGIAPGGLRGRGPRVCGCLPERRRNFEADLRPGTHHRRRGGDTVVRARNAAAQGGRWAGLSPCIRRPRSGHHDLARARASSGRRDTASPALAAASSGLLGHSAAHAEPLQAPSYPPRAFREAREGTRACVQPRAIRAATKRVLPRVATPAAARTVRFRGPGRLARGTRLVRRRSVAPVVHVEQHVSPLAADGQARESRVSQRDRAVRIGVRDSSWNAACIRTGLRHDDIGRSAVRHPVRNRGDELRAVVARGTGSIAQLRPSCWPCSAAIGRHSE